MNLRRLAPATTAVACVVTRLRLRGRQPEHRPGRGPGGTGAITVDGCGQELQFASMSAALNCAFAVWVALQVGLCGAEQRWT